MKGCTIYNTIKLNQLIGEFGINKNNSCIHNNHNFYCMRCNKNYNIRLIGLHTKCYEYWKNIDDSFPTCSDTNSSETYSIDEKYNIGDNINDIKIKMILNIIKQLRSLNPQITFLHYDFLSSKFVNDKNDILSSFLRIKNIN